MKRTSRASLGLAVLALTACATQGALPRTIADAPANRVYWDHYAGDGYRIKLIRDVGQMGSLCMSTVHLDGRLAAEIGTGESVVFKVAPGAHTLRVMPTQSAALCRSFYSQPQFRTEIRVEGNPGDVRTYRYGFAGSGLPFLVEVTGH